MHVEDGQILPWSYSIRIINHKRNLIVVYFSSVELWSDYEDDYSNNKTVDIILSDNSHYKFNNNNVINEDFNITFCTLLNFNCVGLENANEIPSLDSNKRYKVNYYSKREIDKRLTLVEIKEETKTEVILIKN